MLKATRKSLSLSSWRKQDDVEYDSQRDRPREERMAQFHPVMFT